MVLSGVLVSRGRKRETKEAEILDLLSPPSSLQLVFIEYQYCLSVAPRRSLTV